MGLALRRALRRSSLYVSSCWFHERQLSFLYACCLISSSMVSKRRHPQPLHPLPSFFWFPQVLVALFFNCFLSIFVQCVLGLSLRHARASRHEALLFRHDLKFRVFSSLFLAIFLYRVEWKIYVLHACAVPILISRSLWRREIMIRIYFNYLISVMCFKYNIIFDAVSSTCRY